MLRVNSEWREHDNGMHIFAPIQPRGLAQCLEGRRREYFTSAMDARRVLGGCGVTETLYRAG